MQLSHPLVVAATWQPVPDAATLGPRETTLRPEPGLARGLWEAPRWAFFLMAAVVVLAAALYALWRAGLLARRRRS